MVSLIAALGLMGAVGLPLPANASTALLDAPVYRLRSSSGYHLYTVGPNERDSAVSRYGYTSEGVAFSAAGLSGSNVTAVYRLVSGTGDRLYTTSTAERDSAVSQYGYALEGTAFYAAPQPADGLVPVYRLRERGTGHHLYTTSVAERDSLLTGSSYVGEGTAFYAGPPSTPTPQPQGILLAAGDIASCGSSGDEATAALLDSTPGDVIATLGDNAYDNGTAAEFANCYHPTWGRHMDRTRPSPGNHEYYTPGASGYFNYFGAAAGDPTKGYYSYDLGAWHIIALNSNCSIVSCSPGSAQETWLRADLAAHPKACTLAYWHHARFSSGAGHGSDPTVGPLWQALYDGNADVVLTGHDHNYERIGPLTPGGQLDQARGIRSFVVGTGGNGLYGFGATITGSEVRNSDTFGVLALTLKATGYDWQFKPVAGGTFTDSGSGSCR